MCFNGGQTTQCVLALWRFHSEGKREHESATRHKEGGDALGKGLVIWHVWDKGVFNRCPAGCGTSIGFSLGNKAEHIKETNTWRDSAIAASAWML